MEDFKFFLSTAQNESQCCVPRRYFRSTYGLAHCRHDFRNLWFCTTLQWFSTSSDKFFTKGTCIGDFTQYAWSQSNFGHDSGWFEQNDCVIYSEHVHLCLNVVYIILSHSVFHTCFSFLTFLGTFVKYRSFYINTIYLLPILNVKKSTDKSNALYVFSKLIWLVYAVWLCKG